LRALTDLLAGRGYMLNAPSKDAGLSRFRFGGMRVNFQKSEIIRDGSRVPLSERESRLLQFLVMNRGTAVSRDTLLEHVWGYRRAPVTRTVDVTILRLRQKIENNPADPRFIITVPGVGYRFNG
jgi:two-component system alkaline phosphatase synthesis response regulator PhoP